MSQNDSLLLTDASPEQLVAELVKREDASSAIRRLARGQKANLPRMAAAAESMIEGARREPIMQAAMEMPFATYKSRENLKAFMDWSAALVAKAVELGFEDHIARTQGILQATPLLTDQVAIAYLLQNGQYGGLDPKDINNAKAVEVAIAKMKDPVRIVSLVMGMSAHPREFPFWLIVAMAPDENVPAMQNIISGNLKVIVLDK